MVPQPPDTVDDSRPGPGPGPAAAEPSVSTGPGPAAEPSAPGQPGRVQNGSVAEIRVHGVSGTPIESVLDDPWPRQVAGDDAGRIFRRTLADPSGRVVEGYHWGRYTAGSPSRALWLLLVPFALVNVARFALLMPAERRTRDRVADGVIRLLGLVLTVTLVVTACYLGWNVLARQCGPGACAGDFWLLDWFAGRSPGVREAVGAALPLVVLLVFWQFDRLGFPHDPPGATRRQRPGRNGDLGDPGFWRGARQTSWQRAAHVWSGCAVTGLLALAMLGRPGDWAAREPVFTVACAIAAAVLVAGLLSGVWLVIGNPVPTVQEAVPDGRDPVGLRTWMRVARMSTAGAALAAIGLAAIGLDHVTPGSPDGVGATFSAVANGVFALLGLVLLVLLGVCALLAYGAEGRRLRLGDPTGRRPTIPVSFQPFYFGMGGWLGAALGATVGLGMSAAAVFWMARALGDPVLDGAKTQPQQIEIAAVYWIMAAVWGALAVVLVVALLPLAAWLLRRRTWWLLLAALLAGLGTAGWAVLAHPGPDVLSREAEWLIASCALVLAVGLLVFSTGRDSFRSLLCDDYTSNEELSRAQARVAGRWRIAMIRYRYHHAVGLIATLGGLAVIVSAGACAWLLTAYEELPSALMGNATGPLGQLGVLVVSFGATGLVVLGLGTWQRPALRTGVGVIWDLLSFWPRVGHPLCPPPYGGRAVLAVAGRASQLANRGVPRGEPADQVVLSGHSQGSVITLAACAVILDQAAGKAEERGPEDDLNIARSRVTRDRLYMITYGSQLQFLYARFFPSYLGFARISEVCTAGLRWRNAFRWTDPLGGPVLAWQVPAARRKFGPDLTGWRTMGCDSGCPGHAPVGRCGCTGPCPAEQDPAGRCPDPRYWAVGADARLRDPATIVDSPDVPRLAARGHSGYLSDPAYEYLVRDLLDGSTVGLSGTAGCRRSPEAAPE
jgi:hypothetical protein